MDSAREPSTPAPQDRPGAEHLLIFPEREIAEQVSEQLTEEGFAQVSLVREAARTEDDDEAHEWAVHVVDHRLPDTTGGGAYEGLRDRFAGLAKEHDGWYDDPADSRAPVTADSDTDERDTGEGDTGERDAAVRTES